MGRPATPRSEKLRDNMKEWAERDRRPVVLRYGEPEDASFLRYSAHYWAKLLGIKVGVESHPQAKYSIMEFRGRR